MKSGESVPWRVGCADGSEYDANCVIIASPAWAAAGMLSAHDDGISAVLRQIPYASMTVVCFGYERERVSHPLDGFGYLIPKKEGRSILGTLWDSSMFENRAPQGKLLLRSMMGGACFPGHVMLSDDEVVMRVRRDLQDVMGISGEPSFIRIFRHPQAIPQYIVGHAVKLKALEERLAGQHGLILTGNSYRGIGLSDCVAAAQRASDEALAIIR